MEENAETGGESPTRLIDARIRELDDWRGKALSRVRALIKEAVPEVVEEWKWRGVPVWYHNGMICTGETYRDVVKVTFLKGASLADPSGLFNASLEGNARRAIDLHEGDDLNEDAFKTLVRAASATNKSPARSPAKAGAKARPGAGKGKPIDARTGADVPAILSGGNPQIAKADGDAPVQAYIAAMPGWKRDIGQRLDALIVSNVPRVRKAVRWNSPFFGVEGRGWFLSFHVFTHYVKVTFFRGASLLPVPPGASKQDDVRYLDIREHDGLDEEQIASWVKQAAALPGWAP